MAILYIHPETQQKVDKEAWRWVVIYEDGTEVRQFEHTREAGPVFHQFGEVDMSRVQILRLEHDTLNPVTLVMPAGGKPIHRYVNSVLENGAIKLRWYVIGWQKGTERMFAVITNTNEVILTEDYNFIRAKDETTTVIYKEDLV